MRSLLAPPNGLARLPLHLVFGLALLALTPPLCSDEVPTPLTGTYIADVGGGARRIDSVLPGVVLDRTVGRDAAGASHLLVLVDLGEWAGPRRRRIFRIDLDSAAPIELTAAPPEDAHSLVAIPAPGRGDLVLLGSPGLIQSARLVVASGDLTPLHEALREPLLDLRAQPIHGLGTEAVAMPAPTPGEAGGGERQEPAPLALVGVGRLDLYRVTAADRLEPLARLALPVGARRTVSGLSLETPPVVSLAGWGSPASRGFAVGPTQADPWRLETFLLAPDVATAGVTQPIAAATSRAAGEAPANGPGIPAWSRLPEAETVAESWYGASQGAPLLVVTTREADRISVFAKHRLRVFRPAADRSRSGAPAVLATSTASRLWQDTHVALIDLEADGREDLAVLQPQGFGGDELVVDVFSGLPDGGFAARSRHSVVKVPAGEAVFARDVDGDATADLINYANGRLSVVPGIARARRKSFEESARWSVPRVSPANSATGTLLLLEDELHSSPDRVRDLRVVDLDADGRDEILFPGVEQAGRGIVQIVVLP